MTDTDTNTNTNTTLHNCPLSRRDLFIGHGVTLVPVAADADGLRADALASALAGLAARGEKAKLLYVLNE